MSISDPGWLNGARFIIVMSRLNLTSAAMELVPWLNSVVLTLQGNENAASAFSSNGIQNHSYPEDPPNSHSHKDPDPSSILAPSTAVVCTGWNL